MEAVRWSAVSYRVPTATARQRACLWRRLQRAGALNLEVGTWAVAHDEQGAVDLTEVLQLVADAGGASTVHEVRRGAADDDHLEHLLVRACGHLWDGFFNDCDELLEQLELREPGERPDSVLDEVRGAYGAVRPRDVLFGGTGQRASRRLQEAYRLVDPADGSTFADRAYSHAILRRHPLAGPLVGRPLADGSVRYLATTRPLVPHSWEQAFAAFEAEVYLADEERVELTHGAFSFRATPATRAEVVAGLTRRLRTFAQAWG